MSDGFKEQGQAEWDQRQAFHQRLHHAILYCFDSMHNRDFDTWYDSLLIFYLNLIPFFANTPTQTVIDLKMKKAKNILKYNNMSLIDKKQIFFETQIEFHKVMRSRGFDVPVVEHSPGSILKREKSF